ncbi:hypothetical protein Val02_83410 [Virgisporangium aliadipatigenens]|uniref:Macro domain-containing protein n=1 Tax=Virgisporangium aliadipatigenens TaxID=741659 RepID=A0A8J3YXB6_9ACTN|nr:macro domain-containing protein [Virgisporangium aliadipatigenens]GIJ51455.1 hypothetical protein Val02_83410 [Virgisporangium aliadipatigenens]
MKRQLRVVLADIDTEVVRAWLTAFADEAGVDVHKGSILDEQVDAWVTPTNSAGRMDSGVDAVVRRHLGAGIQLRVQRAIRMQFGGTLPIGSALCVSSGAANPRYLISTPTTVHPGQDVGGPLSVALACAAAFQAIHLQNAKVPGSVRSVALVGLGAGTGRVPPRVCAELMRAGYALFHEHRFGDYDELRATISAQLDAIEHPPAGARVRIAPPRSAAADLAILGG